MSRHDAVRRGPAPAGVGLAAAAVVSIAAPAWGVPWPAAPVPSEAVLVAPALPGLEPSADARCLAQAVYYEAGGESRAGREAVAEVVLNRLHSPAYPKTVCGVVFQGASRVTGCQFTFACDGSRARRPDARGWADALAVAGEALAGRLASPVGDATHYHALWVRPAWSLAMRPTLRIGGHQFYAAGPAAAPAAFAATAAGPRPRATTFSVWGLQVATVTPGPGGLASLQTP